MTAGVNLGNTLPVFAYTSYKISDLLIELRNEDAHMVIILNENESLTDAYS